MKQICLFLCLVISVNVFSQNVGIGTTAPTSLLDVNGQITIDQKNFGGFGGLLIKGNSPVSNYPNIGFSIKNTAATDIISALIGGTINNNVAGSEAMDLRFYTSTTGLAGLTTRLVIKDNGNVGIGEVNPTVPLNFASTLGNKLSLFGNSSNHYGFGIQGSLMQVYTDGSGADIAFGYGNSNAFTENMRIKGNGNVGIGTTAPGAKLHIGANSTGYAFRIDQNSSGHGILAYVNSGSSTQTVFRAQGFLNGLTILANGTVSIGTTSSPNASATLDVSSTTGGFLFPRMTTAQRNAIASPAAGLQIYNTDRNCLDMWNNKGWMSFCDNGIFFNDIEILQSPSIYWSKKAEFGGTASFSAVGFSIGSKGYIGTGADVTFRKDFWEYDPATNAWTQKADFGGTARQYAVGFSIGAKGYIGTGSDGIGGVYKKDFWEYDPATNAWTQKADFGGTARARAVGFSIGAKGYIGTGYELGIAYKKDFWEYDPGTNTWTQKTDFGGTGRQYAVGFSIGARGYIGTGNEGVFFVYKKDFWEYDPGTNGWTQKTDFGGTARQYAVGFSIGAKGYIGTGSDDFYRKDFWEYDPGSNGWTQKADFAGTARNTATGFSIGTKGYIGTGSDGAYKKDFWEYSQ